MKYLKRLIEITNIAKKELFKDYVSFIFTRGWTNRDQHDYYVYSLWSEISEMPGDIIESKKKEFTWFDHELGLEILKYKKLTSGTKIKHNNEIYQIVDYFISPTTLGFKAKNKADFSESVFDAINGEYKIIGDFEAIEDKLSECDFLFYAGNTYSKRAITIENGEVTFRKADSSGARVAIKINEIKKQSENIYQGKDKETIMFLKGI